uniref:uncharacterized protein LOC120884152 isoform X1 n=1 Tax=Ictidomys tridecemlineatus TaxID=43179 RepID=UPI001A9EB5B5|nr:uncharacterized protein LOC120884152 isoform X1 [Ictidomys tridecemlineatus]
MTWMVVVMAKGSGQVSLGLCVCSGEHDPTEKVQVLTKVSSQWVPPGGLPAVAIQRNAFRSCLSIPRKTAELGSALGCSLPYSPVCHFAAEQMDDTEAPFFSHSSGKMNLAKCCRHHPTRFHIHRQPGLLTEHRPIPQPCAGAQGREGRTFSISLLLTAVPWLPADPSVARGCPRLLLLQTWCLTSLGKGGSRTGRRWGQRGGTRYTTLQHDKGHQSPKCPKPSLSGKEASGNMEDGTWSGALHLNSAPRI